MCASADRCITKAFQQPFQCANANMMRCAFCLLTLIAFVAGNRADHTFVCICSTASWSKQLCSHNSCSNFAVAALGESQFSTGAVLARLQLPRAWLKTTLMTRRIRPTTRAQVLNPYPRAPVMAGISLDHCSRLRIHTRQRAALGKALLHWHAGALTRAILFRIACLTRLKVRRTTQCI